MTYSKLSISTLVLKLELCQLKIGIGKKGGRTHACRPVDKRCATTCSRQMQCYLAAALRAREQWNVC